MGTANEEGQDLDTAPLRKKVLAAERTFRFFRAHALRENAVPGAPASKKPGSWKAITVLQVYGTPPKLDWELGIKVRLTRDAGASKTAFPRGTVGTRRGGIVGTREGAPFSALRNLDFGHLKSPFEGGFRGMLNLVKNFGGLI